MEVASKTKRAFTRSQCTGSLSKHDESTLTDHAVQENHMIDLAKATVIDRDPDRPTWWSPFTSIRKVNEPWIGMRAAINSAIRTAAVLSRRLVIVSRSRRTEYQLSSDEGLWKRSIRQRFLVL